MAREKEDFRDNLCRIDAKFPEVELLNIKEASEWLGVDRRTVMKIMNGKILPGNKISKVALARAIS